jgi:hypothetical protein
MRPDVLRRANTDKIYRNAGSAARLPANRNVFDTVSIVVCTDGSRRVDEYQMSLCEAAMEIHLRDASVPGFDSSTALPGSAKER